MNPYTHIRQWLKVRKAGRLSVIPTLCEQIEMAQELGIAPDRILGIIGDVLCSPYVANEDLSGLGGPE